MSPVRKIQYDEGSGIATACRTFTSLGMARLRLVKSNEGSEVAMKKKYEPKSEYQKMLLDPQWQRKRLEILQRDNFTCQSCGNEEETLHVHHRYYVAGAKPWEYSDHALLTLCATCHEAETASTSILKSSLLPGLFSTGMLAVDLSDLLLTLVKEPKIDRLQSILLIRVIREALLNEEFRRTIWFAYRQLPDEKRLSALDAGEDYEG